MRSASLDGLRGAAALVVVLSHVCMFYDFPKAISWSGQTAVQVFFVLSGYLMATQYLGKPISAAGLDAYARRRIGRVVPLYIAVVIASFVVTSFGFKYFYIINTYNLWRHLLFIDGISALWAVPVEVHFYVAFPLLWLVFSYSRVLGGLILACLIPAFLFSWVPWIPNPFYYAYFLAGVVVSFIPIRKLPGWAFLAALAGMVPALPGMTTPPENPYPGFWTSPYSLLAVCFLLYATRTTNLAATLLGNCVMANIIGKISYPVYLLHPPVIMVLLLHTNARGSLVLFAGAVIVMSLAVAWLVHIAFEEPMRRLIASGRKNAVAVQAAPA